MQATKDCTMNVYSSQTNRERVRYFPRQLLTADDMRAEQEYFREKLRRHNRLVHGWGVVCGMEIKPPQPQEPDWQVTVCPGFLLTPCGDEILLTENAKFDVKTGLQTPDPCTPRWPCPPTPESTAASEPTSLHLAIRYAECSSRPVRVHPAGCGCDESACEYSRVRDSFELRCLLKLPESHEQMKDFYQHWCGSWTDWITQRGQRKTLFPLPVLPCSPSDDDSWVILATVTLPTTGQPRISDGMIQYDNRFPLYSSTGLQIIEACK